MANTSSFSPTTGQQRSTCLLPGHRTLPHNHTAPNSSCNSLPLYKYLFVPPTLAFLSPMCSNRLAVASSQHHCKYRKYNAHFQDDQKDCNAIGAAVVLCQTIRGKNNINHISIVWNRNPLSLNKTHG